MSEIIIYATTDGRTKPKESRQEATR